MVDFFLLLMLAGAGDELEGLKRGIIEMTDIITINKADSFAKKDVQQACAKQGTLHLYPPTESEWSPNLIGRHLTFSSV